MKHAGLKKTENHKTKSEGLGYSASAIIVGVRQWVRGIGRDLGLLEQPLHVRGKGTETESGLFWAVITLLSGLDQCHIG